MASKVVFSFHDGIPHLRVEQAQSWVFTQDERSE